MMHGATMKYMTLQPKKKLIFFRRYSKPHSVTQTGYVAVYRGTFCPVHNSCTKL